MRRLLLLLLVLSPALALADARIEARRHFKTGMALIAEGLYDDGVAELMKAYRIKPHPNVLFNVAKAYHSAGRIEDAIKAYQRYLDTDPPDSIQVRQQVATLKANLPAPPPVELPRPVLVEPSPAAAPVVDSQALARLEAVAARLEEAARRAEQPVEAPRVTVEDALGPQPESSAEGFSDLPYEETVVAASRRAQSSLQAPNATTVITGEEIRLSGLQSLPDILRRVPGAEVMTMGASSTNVSFRGFNQRIANKVLVLIDGRPEYQDFLGLTMWPALPIGVEEIERIEVIRGPSGALYGANAMLGVVNIITRAPGTGPAAEITGLVGTGNAAAGSFVASGGQAVRFRASAGYGQADKFSRDFAEGRADTTSRWPEPNLANRSARGNLTLFHAFNRDVSVSASGGVNRLYTEVYALGLLRNFALDGVSAYTKADATLGPVKLRFFWNHLDATSGPQYEPTGQRTLLTKLESNVFDGELLFQKALELFGTHLLGVGAATRLKRLKWGYIGPLQQELHAAAFVQDEWRILKPLSLVASYRIDRHPLLDKGQPGYAQSPRVSLVYTPVEGHSVRGAFATAFRQPTFFESYMDIRIPVPGLPGASVLTNGNRALRPERLVSFEVGYRGELARQGLNFDVAAYWNVVSDLVVLSAVTPLPADQAFDAQTQTFVLGRSLFVNDPTSYTARGGELGITWNALSGLDLRASGAVQQIVANQPVAVCGPCSQAPVAKVNAGFTWRTSANLDLSADVSYATNTTWVEREPSASDPTQIANLQNPLGAYTVINARVGYRFLNDRVTVAVVGSQLGPNHQEHPFGNDVNRRVFAQLTVTP